MSELKRYKEESEHLIQKSTMECNGDSMKSTMAPQEVMRRIKIDNFKLIGRQWQSQGDGLDMTDFVKVLYKYVEHSNSENVKVVNGLIQLFHDIDINGDDSVEWSEFTQYISDSVENFKKQRPDEGSGATQPNYLIEQIKLAKLTEFHQFRFLHDTHDKGRHRSQMHQVVYNKGPSYISFMRPLVMYCDERSTFVSWLTADSLDVIEQASVPVRESGGFIKSIGCENFKMGSNKSKIFSCHTIYAISCTDCHIHLYKQRVNQIMYHGSFDIGPIPQHKLWYLKNHKVWLSCGKDLNMNSFNFSEKKKLTLKNPFKIHSDEVVDVIEIEDPEPAIITCGLDKKICIYSLMKQEALRVLPIHHRTSVRKLCSFQDFGNFLLSSGSDQDIYVWAMENTVNDPLHGRLRGHKSPVTDLFRFPMQPFAASIDTKGIIKIWDVRDLECLQTIIPNKNTEINCNLILINAESFLSYSNRFKILKAQRNLEASSILAEPKESYQDRKDKKKTKAVYFNKYYMMIVVVSAESIKMYRMQDGFMQTLVTNVFNDDHVYIQGFKMDQRCRRAYVSSTKGETKVLNIKNGVLLKTCFRERVMKGMAKDSDESYCEDELAEQLELEEIKHEMEKEVPHDHSSSNEVKSARQDPNLSMNRESREVFRMVLQNGNKKKNFLSKQTTKCEKACSKKIITSKKIRPVEEKDEEGVHRPVRIGSDMIDSCLIWRDEIKQVLGCDKDSFFVYDDAQPANERDQQSELLRIVTGMHQGEICCLQYNFELSLIATGTTSGEIAVFDYEQSKLLDFAVGHTAEITTIQFVWPYPIMITTSLDSQIIIWKVRSVGEDNGLVDCLYKFQNKSLAMTTKDVYQMIPAGVSACQLRTGAQIKGISREKKNRTTEQIMLGASTYRDFKTNFVLSQLENYISFRGKGIYRGPAESEKMRQKLLDTYLKKDDGQSKVEQQFDEQLSPDTEEEITQYGQSQPIKRLLSPGYDLHVSREKERYLMYLGDELGFLKVLDLSYILQHEIRYKKCTQTHAEYKGKNFFPFRMEGIAISYSFAKSILRAAKKRSKSIKIMFSDPLKTRIQLREVWGHEDIITHLSVDQEDGCVITASNDHQVRIWSEGLDLWGNINQINEEIDEKWHFPAEILEKKAAKEKMVTSTIIETLEKENVQIMERNSVRSSMTSALSFLYKKDRKKIEKEKLNDNSSPMKSMSEDSIEMRLQDSLLGKKDQVGDSFEDVDVLNHTIQSIIETENSTHQQDLQSMKRRKSHTFLTSSNKKVSFITKDEREVSKATQVLLRRNKRKSMGEEPDYFLDEADYEIYQSKYLEDEKPTVHSSSMPELKIVANLALKKNKSSMKLNEFEEYKQMNFPGKIEEIMLPGTVKLDKSIEVRQKDHIQENRLKLKLPELKEMSQSNFSKVKYENPFAMTNRDKFETSMMQNTMQNTMRDTSYLSLNKSLSTTDMWDFSRFSGQHSRLRPKIKEQLPDVGRSTSYSKVQSEMQKRKEGKNLTSLKPVKSTWVKTTRIKRKDNISMNSSMYGVQMKKTTVKSPSRRRIDRKSPEGFKYDFSDRFEGPDTTERKEALKSIGEKNSLYTQPELVGYSEKKFDSTHPFSTSNKTDVIKMVDDFIKFTAEDEYREEGQEIALKKGKNVACVMETQTQQQQNEEIKHHLSAQNWDFKPKGNKQINVDEEFNLVRRLSLAKKIFNHRENFMIQKLQ